ncbi:MAG: hypothetical protein JNL74_08270, partial [Fibrobacteres bacterium]|nr:hypothetical protein [Fibrobacterota bacterium]
SGYTGIFSFAPIKLVINGTGDFQSGGLINPNNGAIVFNGSGIQYFMPRLNTVLPHIKHEGAGTLRLQTNPLRALSFHQNNGSLDLNTLNIDSIAFDFTIQNGHGTTFSGASLGGRLIKVNGNMTLSGTPPTTEINMNPGSNYTLAVNGLLYANLCNIGYSTASLSQGNASNSTNGGSNTGWTFGALKTWVGSGNWSTPANWSGGTLPTMADSVVFNSGSICSLDVDASVRAFVMGSGYTSAFKTGNQNLTVRDHADFRSSGAIITAPGFALEFIGSSTSGQFFPKQGLVYPKIVKNGVGTIQQNMNAFKADTLIIANGEFKLASVMADTIFKCIEVQNGKLDIGSATLRLGAQNVNFATPAIILGESGNLSFIGTAPQSFTPKPGMRFQTIQFENSGSTVSVLSNGFRAGSLYLVTGGLDLGNGLVDSIESSIVINGGTNLNFGSSLLKTATANVNLSSLATLTAGSGAIEFTSNSPQTLVPRYGVLNPMIVKKGTGTLTVNTHPLRTAKIVINEGFVNMDTSFAADTLAIQASGTINLAPYNAEDTVNTVIGTGSLQLNQTLLNVSGNLDATGFSNISATSGGFRFVGSTPQTYKPRAGVMSPDIEQSGTGTTTIINNPLKVSALYVSNGTLNLGNGLVDSTGAIYGTASGTLNFGSSTLKLGGISDIFFGNGYNIIPGTGTLEIGGASPVTFKPKNNMSTPRIKYTGSNTLTIDSTITMPALVISSGVVTTSNDASFKADSLIVHVGATYKSAGMMSNYDTVNSFSCNGTLDFTTGDLGLVILGHLDLRSFSGNVINLGTAVPLIFSSANPQNLQISNMTYPFDFLQRGTGGTTITSSEHFKCGGISVNLGSFSVGAASIDSMGWIYMTGGSLTVNSSNFTIYSFEAGPGHTINLNNCHIKTTNVFNISDATINHNNTTFEIANTDTNNFCYANNASLPTITKTGAGIAMLVGFVSKKLSVSNGSAWISGGSKIDTIIVNAPAIVGTPDINNDSLTVKTFEGNGELQFGSLKHIVNGNLDLSFFSNISWYGTHDRSIHFNGN